MAEQAACTEQQDTDAADGSIVHMYEYRDQFVDRWTDRDYTEYHSDNGPDDSCKLSVISTERAAVSLDKKQYTGDRVFYRKVDFVMAMRIWLQCDTYDMFWNVFSYRYLWIHGGLEGRKPILCEIFHMVRSDNNGFVCGDFYADASFGSGNTRRYNQVFVLWQGKYCGTFQ